MTAALPIHELGPKGDGVHLSQRGRIYIDRALPGDSVEVDIRADDEGVLRGDLLRVVKSSPHRVAAPCPNYEVCGGCTLQHAEETFYRQWKLGIVRDALQRRGLKPKVWRDPVFLPAGDRRRATFAAFKRNNRVTLGYFRRRSHNVTEIASCLIADPSIMELRTRLALELVPILQEGKSADIFIQTVSGRFEIAITGPIGTKGTPDLLLRQALAHLARQVGVDRISWRARERETLDVMIETRPLIAKFGALDVALPPTAFLQPTKAGETALAEAVMELLPGKGKFADLFSGCGTFTGPMLERGPVDAYESVEPAVRALFKAKGPRTPKAFRRDLFRNPLRRDEANRYDAIVFDPPRAGAQEQAKALAAGKVPLLVGVSCNPATFARDARILVDGGYWLQSLKVIDQFTWSHHVELVASFTKRRSR